jgi:CubicO group peptidase (beta-lactamase class C family)
VSTDRTPLDPELLQDAASYAARWVSYRQHTQWMPGVVFALAHDGRMLREGAAGVASLETNAPMTVEHRFRIASHSKMFTATALMRLVDARRLRLDDPVGAHIDGIAADVAAVPLRELLAHGGGIVRDGDNAGFWELSGDFPDAAALASMLRSPGVLPRNSRFKYSNVGFALLGRVIESVTRTSYDDHLTAEVLRPLGMTDTTTDLTDDVVELMATGHRSGRARAERTVVAHAPARAYAPAAGLCSTARDLVRFATSNCFGVDGVVSDTGKRELQHVQWQVPEETKQHYALGFAAYDVGDRRMFGHGGGYVGYITATMFDPVDRLVAVVLTNAIDGPASEWATGMVRLVDTAQRIGAEPGGSDPSRLDEMVGRYSGAWTTQDVVRFGRHLVGINPEQGDPVNLVVRLTAADDGAGFVLGDCPGYGSPGERVRLEDGGAVLQWAGHRLHRVDE